MSKNCVSGTILTLTGNGFDYVTLSNNLVTVTDVKTGSNTSVQCTVVPPATSTMLMCMLWLTNNTFDERTVFAFDVSLNVASGFSTTFSDVNTLVLGGGDSPGWISGAPEDTPPKSKKVVEIVVPIVVILLAVIAVVVFLRSRRSAHRRTDLTARDLEQIQEELIPGRATTPKTSSNVV